MSYSNLAFVNAFTFLAAGILYASVGLRHKKNGNDLEPQEVNDQKFVATMKSSYTQAKKASGLLTIIGVLSLINGVLGAMSALIPIVMAGHKTTMLISSYSFTMAVLGVVVSCDAALGSMFGPQLFKKVSAFTMTVVACGLSILTTLSAITAHIYVVLPFFFLLAASASITFIKLSQWSVNTVERKILASTVGMLNTCVMVAYPIMTTIFTTISGASDARFALIALLSVEATVLLVTVRMSIKVKKS
ncbi:major facilitator permease [Lactobacillus kalixensis DSM 16043]|uniref:Major facilitator permease n=1 Tax=Lactobacillus kalixensis DSM 16043 TaxID=1423763 RepID=A0A0R1U7W9_9LACO|nr:major facilitator permease [Lactobacillus kalixensis DSM 16043]